MESIEIPFGAKDSELKGWEYKIPEGFEAEIKDGKIIVKQAESKDEKTMKELIAYLAHRADVTEFIDEGEDCKRWISYLITLKYAELRARWQQEQKSSKWSEEDEAVLDALIRRFEGEDIYVSPHLAVEWLKSLRPQPHWKPSEEQMYALKNAIETYRVRHNASTSGDNVFKGLESLYEDIKELH